MLKQLSYYDPAVAFLEIGVEVEGETAWKVYGLDLDKTYGGLQGIGGLRAIIQDGNVIRIIDDVQGNVLGYVDTDNKITWNSVRDYDAYGPLGELESGGCGKSLEKLLDSNSLSIALFKAHAWRGKRQEANGLIYLGKRYYDPTTGRFISPDPLGHSGSIDLYSYANGDPVNFVDPSGMFACAAMEGVNRFAGKILPYMPFYQSSRDLAAATTGIDPETGKPFSDLGRFFAGANSFFGGVLDAVSLGKGTAAAKLASSGIATMGRFVGNSFKGLGKATHTTPKLQQLEFSFARGARIQTPTVTSNGEIFVRVGAEPRNLKFGTENFSGVQPGTYAFPESVFNQMKHDPKLIKDLGDLPGQTPQYYRILRPPAGTPIQRGVVPGSEFGGQGGIPEVIFPKGF